jgi:hypothetical protein
MSSPEGTRLRGVAGDTPGGSLNLIHTNNCSNPISMRVPTGFDGNSGLSFSTRKEAFLVMEGPLGLMIFRRSNGTKSTG